MTRWTAADLAEAAKPRRKRARTRPPRLDPLERDVQRAVLERLLLDPRVAWCCRLNTGAARYQDGKGRERFVRFGFPGMSDVVGQMAPLSWSQEEGRGSPLDCLGGAFLAVEVKRCRTKLTDDQRAFLLRVREAGGVAGVARSADDVDAILRGEGRIE